MISATDPGNRGDVFIHVKNSTIAISINYNWQKYVSGLLSKIASSKVTALPRADDFYSGVNEALAMSCAHETGRIRAEFDFAGSGALKTAGPEV
jgi:hypothetical protein